MPYIPQFNKLSMQEMAYAPTLMRQQHDDAVAKQMELAEALKFDYLNQDASGLEPILQGYNKDIEDVSKQIAQQGFSHDLKNKVLGLRSKYVTDDKIRTYKKNYSDAMSQWEEQKKRLIQQGASGDLLNRQKASFFSGYHGAYDPEGFKREFTAGKTSNVYDVMEDTKKAFSNLGSTGQIVGSSGSSIREKTMTGADGRPATYFEVTDNKTGQVIRNTDQRQAVANYLKAEYGDESTDRGLYAKIAGLAPEHIDNIVDQVSRSVAENRYAQLPQSDTNISGVERGQKTSTGFYGQLRQSGTGLVPSSINDLDKKIYSHLSNKLASEEANNLGVKGVKTLDDLKKIASDDKDIYTPHMMPGTFVPGEENKPYKSKNPYSERAKIALSNIENKLKNNPQGVSLPTYELNPLAMASGKSITEINNLQEGLDKYVTNHIDRFTPIDGDKKDIQKLSPKSISVSEISPNFKEREAGVVLYLNIVDKDGKQVKMPVTLDSKDLNTEENIASYLGQMSPIIGIEYQYGKLSKADKSKYLDALEKSPSDTPEEAAAKKEFIEDKRQYLDYIE